MLFIGLTGSIATGKSTVAEFFKKLGCYIIDADKLAHKVYEKNRTAYNKVVEEFGDNILDKSGNIDRKKLRSIVLKDGELLKKLEEATHPEIEKLRNNIIENIKQKDEDAIIIYDVPLLFEKNLENLFDYIVVVYADKDDEIMRLRKRSKMTKDEALRAIALQIPTAEKIKKADFVIDNSRSIETTKKNVKELFTKLQQLNNERNK